jgi:phosphoglycolate phosphatase
MAPSKPHPGMLLQALAATELRSIGVGWGYHQADRLMAAGAHRIAKRVDELTRCIRSAMSG